MNFEKLLQDLRKRLLLQQQTDYLRRMSLKMLQIECKSQNPPQNSGKNGDLRDDTGNHIKHNLQQIQAVNPKYLTESNKLCQKIAAKQQQRRLLLQQRLLQPSQQRQTLHPMQEHHRLQPQYMQQRYLQQQLQRQLVLQQNRLQQPLVKSECPAPDTNGNGNP
ncbi:hypothetical protein PTKIN_Ptkin13bG0140600 [Pterospermum kingtungense]